MTDEECGIPTVVEVAMKMQADTVLAREVERLRDHLTRETRFHEQAVTDWAGCRERVAALEVWLARVTQERDQARTELAEQPTARQWAAWFRESADQADDLTAGQAEGFRIAAAHLEAPEIAAKAARIFFEDDR